MDSRYFLSLFAIVCSVYFAEAQPSKASFCRRYDCPLFTVASSNRDYEHRIYSPSTWVSTRVVDTTYRTAGRDSFRTLFSYISGENEESMKIDMTVPVIAKVIPTDDDGDMEADFTYSFFVPYEHQDNPPAPSNSDVFIDQKPVFEAYVRNFGGWASQSDYMRHARILKANLDRDGVEYDDTFYYTAGYDSPFRWFFRRNEVWVLKATTTA